LILREILQLDHLPLNFNHLHCSTPTIYLSQLQPSTFKMSIPTKVVIDLTNEENEVVATTTGVRRIPKPYVPSKKATTGRRDLPLGIRLNIMEKSLKIGRGSGYEWEASESDKLYREQQWQPSWEESQEERPSKKARVDSGQAPSPSAVPALSTPASTPASEPAALGLPKNLKIWDYNVHHERWAGYLDEDQGEYEQYKLHNGSYPCLHPCHWDVSGTRKTATTCTHKCCKEGVQWKALRKSIRDKKKAISKSRQEVLEKYPQIIQHPEFGTHECGQEGESNEAQSAVEDKSKEAQGRVFDENQDAEGEADEEAQVPESTAASTEEIEQAFMDGFEDDEQEVVVEDEPKEALIVVSDESMDHEREIYAGPRASDGKIVSLEQQCATEQQRQDLEDPWKVMTEKEAEKEAEAEDEDESEDESEDAENERKGLIEILDTPENWPLITMKREDLAYLQEIGHRPNKSGIQECVEDEAKKREDELALFEEPAQLRMEDSETEDSETDEEAEEEWRMQLNSFRMRLPGWRPTSRKYAKRT
jgi:hypothetical protein